MNREKHFHPLAALHLLRKTLLVYLLPLVQVLFDRNWDALRAALRQELVLLFFISAVCWAVYYGGRWQVEAKGTVHVSWRLGVRLDRALRAEGLAALMLEQPLLYRLTGACRVVLYPVGQTKTITLYLTRQQAEELADVLLPVTDPLWHAPKGGEKLAFTVLGANGLSTLIYGGWPSTRPKATPRTPRPLPLRNWDSWRRLPPAGCRWARRGCWYWRAPCSSSVWCAALCRRCITPSGAPTPSWAVGAGLYAGTRCGCGSAS